MLKPLNSKKKLYKLLLTLFPAFALIVFCASAFADYKIILKNGSEFIVDDYKDVDGRIKFSIMDGEIEIDKSNIEDIKKVKAVKSIEEPAPAPGGPPAETMKKDSSEEPVTAEKGTVTQTKRQEIVNRLKEIAKKKEEMRAEGEKLTNERKKLEEDIKKEGRVTSIREKRELERRTLELEEKIKKFNEELNSIEQEQERLLREAGIQQK